MNNTRVVQDVGSIIERSMFEPRGQLFNIAGIVGTTSTLSDLRKELMYCLSRLKASENTAQTLNRMDAALRTSNAIGYVDDVTLDKIVDLLEKIEN